VTGATGFVGQVAARTFDSLGHSVRAALRAPRTGLTCESVVVGEVGPETDWSRALESVSASLIDRNRRVDGSGTRRWSDGRP
jgi:hypothetical protein